MPHKYLVLSRIDKRHVLDEIDRPTGISLFLNPIHAIFANDTKISLMVAPWEREMLNSQNTMARRHKRAVRVGVPNDLGSIPRIDQPDSSRRPCRRSKQQRTLRPSWLVQRRTGETSLPCPVPRVSGYPAFLLSLPHTIYWIRRIRENRIDFLSRPRGNPPGVHYGSVIFNMCRVTIEEKMAEVTVGPLQLIRGELFTSFRSDNYRC